MMLYYLTRPDALVPESGCHIKDHCLRNDWPSNSLTNFALKKTEVADGRQIMGHKRAPRLSCPCVDLRVCAGLPIKKFMDIPCRNRKIPALSHRMKELSSRFVGERVRERIVVEEHQTAQIAVCLFPEEDNNRVVQSVRPRPKVA